MIRSTQRASLAPAQSVLALYESAFRSRRFQILLLDAVISLLLYFSAKVRWPIRRRRYSRGDWHFAVAGDDDHRRDFSGGFSGDEGRDVPEG